MKKIKTISIEIPIKRNHTIPTYWGYTVEYLPVDKGGGVEVSFIPLNQSAATPASAYAISHVKSFKNKASLKEYIAKQNDEYIQMPLDCILKSNPY